MIQVENLEIRLPAFSVTGVNLNINSGQFFALIGPTGAGKTLILEAIGGMVPVESGRISVNGIDVTHLPPEKRKTGIVYQDCALFPHLDVYSNIVYGFRYQKNSRGTLQSILQPLTGLLNLDHLMRRFPTHLSGGEKQRVAIARALCVQPSVLLLDEPLSSIDPIFRDEIRRLLKSIHETLGITVLMITHDFSQLTFLADQAAIVNMGKILQQGTVDELFQRPVNQFVAEFVGMKTILPASFEGAKAIVGEMEILTLNDRKDRSLNFIAIRPEDIILGKAEELAAESNSFMGVVREILDEGPYSEIIISVGDVKFVAATTKSVVMRLHIVPEAPIRIHIPPAAIHTF